MKLIDFCKELESHIIGAYEDGTTIEQAERLAAKFLHGQMLVSADLKIADLESRMRKSGVKAVRAATYTATVSKTEKKPTEGQLEHTLNVDPLIGAEQDALDEAEALRDDLKRYYDIFGNAHIYFRSIAKGAMLG